MAEDLFSQGLRGVLNWATGTLDFSEDDIVVRLGSAPDGLEGVDQGGEYIYVGRDGDGEIRVVEGDKLQDAIDKGRGTFVNAADLSDAGIAKFSENVAADAAWLIMNNNEGMRPEQVFDMVGSAGDAKSIAELRPMLQRTSPDSPIRRGEIPDRADGGYEAAYQEEAETFYKINTTLELMDVADALPDYRDDLLEQAEAEMGELASDHVREQITNPPEAKVVSPDGMMP